MADTGEVAHLAVLVRTHRAGGILPNRIHCTKISQLGVVLQYFEP